MPEQVTYTVKFPDNFVQKFQGPADMSDSDAFARATQERSIASGKIQTTWFGGAAKQMGQERGANAALIGGVGMATGVAPVVAAAPLIARWIDYATKAYTGEKPSTPSLADQATDVATGVVSAYGPAAVTKALEGVATASVPHQSPITGNWVKGASGSGMAPWIARSVGELSNAVRNSDIGVAVGSMRPGYAPAGIGGATGVAVSLAAPALAAIKQSLTMPESKHVMELRRQGKSEAEALQAIANQRSAQ